MAAKQKEPRLTVVEESETGMNIRFKDNRTNEILSKTEVLRRIDRGEYTDYHRSRTKDGTPYVRSNPDGKERNNLE